MKKIKKLSLSGLAQESVVMSVQEQMNIYAGSGIDGFCYFEGLEILSNIFGCNYSDSYYINSYASSHGGYSSIIDFSTGELLGVDPSSANEYLHTQFEASSVGLSGYSAALASGNKILTSLNVGNGVVHAIVITGYDPNTGNYTYSDANGGGQTSANQLNFSMSMSVSNCYTH